MGIAWRGDDGRLSLLWRVVIVFLGSMLIWRLIGDGIGSFSGPAYEDRLGHAVRAVLTSALAVPLIILARRYLDRRTWTGLGLTSPAAGWRPFLFGLAWWLVPALLGLALTLGLGWVQITLSPPDTQLILLALASPLLVLLYEALPEELIFRGYFYRNLADSYPRWLAVVGQAALFTLWGAAIGAAGSVERIILFFTFSLVLGILRVVTGNLWAAIGFHVAFQSVAQFMSAAVRAGVVTIDDQPTLELIAFWFFPIVLGSIVLVVASVRRGRSAWREPDPEPSADVAPVPAKV